MMRTTPFRRISLHFSQMRFTLARTFMIPLTPGRSAGMVHTTQVNPQGSNLASSGNPATWENPEVSLAKRFTSA